MKSKIAFSYLLTTLIILGFVFELLVLEFFLYVYLNISPRTPDILAIHIKKSGIPIVA